MRLDSTGRATHLARAWIGAVGPLRLPALPSLTRLELSNERAMAVPASAFATPREAGTAGGLQTLQRLSGRIGAAVTRTRLEYVFFVIALAWGVAQVFIVPPLQVPDEGDHWFRAWALTDGQLTADSQGMLTLPGVMARTADLYTRLVGGPGGALGLPISLEGQAGFSGYENLFNAPGPPGTVEVASRVASYGPIGYVPQAVGVAIGRLVGAPPLTCFYLARLANLLMAIALFFLAIRLAPFGKQLIVLLALLPMTMFELASVSCDALTISGAVFFTSLLLWASTRPTLRRADVALVLLVAALFLDVKPGYWALILLVFLITPSQLGGRLRYAAFVAGNVLVVVGVSLMFFLLTGSDARVQAAGGPHAQLLFILHQPLSFLGIVWSNVREGLLAWTLQSIGVLGWLSFALPAALYLVALLGGIGFFVRMKEEVRLQPWRRALLAAVGVALFLTMAVALYAFLEPLGSDRIYVQGRYLIPVWLLLLLSVYGIGFAQRQLGRLFMVGVLLVVMVQNLQTLISVYHP
ncbi:MAG: DUF2142 domain-containing protein [Isosphaeraceae bacterium]|nr:DUF2142 domain-containing protein [Isosphaeraceae bacterium]